MGCCECEAVCVRQCGDGGDGVVVLCACKRTVFK